MKKGNYMMKVLVGLMAVALVGGCSALTENYEENKAEREELRGHQMEEMGTLASEHKAQRESLRAMHKAEQALALAKSAKEASEALKVLKEARKALVDSLK